MQASCTAPITPQLEGIETVGTQPLALYPGGRNRVGLGLAAPAYSITKPDRT